MSSAKPISSAEVMGSTEVMGRTEIMSGAEVDGGRCAYEIRMKGLLGPLLLGASPMQPCRTSQGTRW